MGLTSTTVNCDGTKITEFSEITQVRAITLFKVISPILVPIFSPYMRFPVSSLAPFPSYRAVLGKFSPSSGGTYFTQYFSVISKNITTSHILPKTRFFGLRFCSR